MKYSIFKISIKYNKFIKIGGMFSRPRFCLEIIKASDMLFFQKDTVNYLIDINERFFTIFFIN